MKGMDELIDSQHQLSYRQLVQEEFGNWQKTAIGIQFNSIISLDEIEKQTPLAWITRPKCQRHKGQSQVGSKGPSGLQMFGSGLIVSLITSLLSILSFFLIHLRHIKNVFFYQLRQELQCLSLSNRDPAQPLFKCEIDKQTNTQMHKCTNTQSNQLDCENHSQEWRPLWGQPWAIINF